MVFFFLENIDDTVVPLTLVDNVVARVCWSPVGRRGDLKEMTQIKYPYNGFVLVPLTT